MKRKGISAAGFLAGLSTAGRISAPAVLDLTVASADRPRLAVVDRWNGSRFVEVELYWNGAEYVEVAE